jgi:hypothetical protein
MVFVLPHIKRGGSSTKERRHPWNNLEMDAFGAVRT